MFPRIFKMQGRLKNRASQFCLLQLKKSRHEKQSPKRQFSCKNIKMSKPHTKLTLFQISNVEAGVVGRGLGSVPRKMFLLNFEPTGKTPTSFQNKRCRVTNPFFIELIQLNSPFSIRQPKAQTKWSKTKFFQGKKIAVKTFSVFDL